MIGKREHRIAGLIAEPKRKRHFITPIATAVGISVDAGVAVAASGAIAGAAIGGAAGGWKGALEGGVAGGALGYGAAELLPQEAASLGAGTAGQATSGILGTGLGESSAVSQQLSDVSASLLGDGSASGAAGATGATAAGAAGASANTIAAAQAAGYSVDANGLISGVPAGVSPALIGTPVSEAGITGSAAESQSLGQLSASLTGNGAASGTSGAAGSAGSAGAAAAAGAKGINGTALALGALAAGANLLSKPKAQALPGPSSTAAAQGPYFNQPLKITPISQTRQATGQTPQYNSLGQPVYGQAEPLYYTNNDIGAITPAGAAVPGAARGGALSMARGHPVFDSSRGDRYVDGPGDGTSDDVDAKLSDGEYVLPAREVGLIGGGSNKAGAAKIDKWRNELVANAAKHRYLPPSFGDGALNKLSKKVSSR